MQTVIAIEIEDLDTWRVLCALQPHNKELNVDTDNIIGSFVVVSPDSGAEGAIMQPQAVAEHFDHLEPMEKRIKLVRLVK